MRESIPAWGLLRISFACPAKGENDAFLSFFYCGGGAFTVKMAPLPEGGAKKTPRDSSRGSDEKYLK